MPNPLAKPPYKALIDQILDQEIGALSGLREQLDERVLADVVEAILNCHGSVVIVGAGTSSTIARRLAHLLTCSGVPSLFLDPGLARHGYSGFIRPHDLVIALSRGGESDEVNFILKVAKERRAPIVSITESDNTSMSQLCDWILPARVVPEHDAIGVLPLASTLAHAAVGDLLCACVTAARRTPEPEFARVHPGGAVGKRLAKGQSSGAARPEIGLDDLEGYLIDMDGVLWHGDQSLPGIESFFGYLQQHSLPFVLASNNPSKKPKTMVEKAQRLGIPANSENLVTSLHVTTEYLRSRYARGARIHVIGEIALKEQIAEAGFRLVNEDAAAVVVALDRHLTYETIKRGELLIRAGAEFIATNADAFYPSEEGMVPGSGMLVMALAVSAATEPKIMGKPEKPFFDLALRRLGLPPGRVASIGDRLDTDIAGARRCGLLTILLLSGVSGAQDLDGSPIRPDWVFNDLADLASRLHSTD